MDSITPGEEGAGSGAELSSWAVWLAGFFAISATMISLVAIWMQLKNYRKPLLQRFVVRILWMVPIFALSSWVSLVSLDAAFYIDAFRDIYEAFVIYCFFSLLVCYLGGERSLLVMLHGRPYTKHLWPVSMWSKEVDVGDPYTFLFIKRGILQYVYVKPVLAAVTMLLKSNGAYNDGSVSLRSGYFWVSFVYNLSVCLSLYCLGMFFMATQDDLEEFRPIPKFLCIKAVIFFSFWQGFAISVLVALGIMRNTSGEMAVAIQDFLICFEMVFASVGHWYAFSHKDYTELDIYSARMPIYYAIRDASGVKDIIQDSLETLKGTRFNYRTFEPSEGVATEGMSRSGRIMAGLRYTGGGAGKYWLPDSARAGRSDDHGTGGIHDHGQQHQYQHYQYQPSPRPGMTRNHTSNSQSFSERAPSLYFDDVEDTEEDGIEELYSASKQLEFGDYNFPAIDVYDPHRSKETDRRKMEKKNKKKARQQQREQQQKLVVQWRQNGGEVDSLLNGQYTREHDGGDETSPLMSESTVSGRAGELSHGVGAFFGKSGWDEAGASSSSAKPGQTGSDRKDDERRESKESSRAARDGCVDNVNGYVPDKRKKRGSNLSPSIAPANTSSRPTSLTPQTQQNHGGLGFGLDGNRGTGNFNHYNVSGDAGPAYGYGYQSYQSGGALDPMQNYGPGSGSSGRPREDTEEHKGPMFFFL